MNTITVLVLLVASCLALPVPPTPSQYAVDITFLLPARANSTMLVPARFHYAVDKTTNFSTTVLTASDFGAHQFLATPTATFDVSLDAKTLSYACKKQSNPKPEDFKRSDILSFFANNAKYLHGAFVTCPVMHKPTKSYLFEVPQQQVDEFAPSLFHMMENGSSASRFIYTTLQFNNYPVIAARYYPDESQDPQIFKFENFVTSVQASDFELLVDASICQ